VTAAGISHRWNSSKVLQGMIASGQRRTFTDDVIGEVESGNNQEPLLFEPCQPIQPQELALKH
jgi:hypothetical protein